MRVNGWRLVDVKTGREAEAGDTLTDFRGKAGDVLVAGLPPRHDASEGKVETSGGLFYAGVYGLRWMLEEQGK